MWGELLNDLDISAIFDCSPGSGALAEAAMQLGIHYAGVCANSHHMVWLQNALDRAALKQIMTQQAPLHDQVLAGQIKEHFMDVVDSLEMQGGAEDGIESSEDEGGNDLEKEQSLA